MPCPQFSVCSENPRRTSSRASSTTICAGITVYSPLRNCKSSAKGAILGLGGLGHMGVQIAKVMGHHVIVISSTERKRVEAMDHLGADAYWVGTDSTQTELASNSFDYILDTLPVARSLDPYLSLLKVDATLIVLGAIGEPLHFLSPTILLGRKYIMGTFIGSMDEVAEMLEFCKENNISSQIEVVKLNYINQALERVEKNDVRYRFVVDVPGSKTDPET